MAAGEDRRQPVLRTVLAALGMTALDTMWLTMPAVEPTQHALYHWYSGYSAFFIPIAADFLTVWVMLALALLAARRTGLRRIAIWSAVLLLQPWVLLRNLRILLPMGRPVVPGAALLAVSVMALVLVVIFGRRLVRPLEPILHAATSVLMVVGLFGLTILGRMAWYAARASQVGNPTGFVHIRSPELREPPHRVIWIVFDELSQEQVFGQRYPGVSLPAFDALAAQSTMFSHVRPVSLETDSVLPSLLQGRAYGGVRYSSGGTLYGRSESQSGEHWTAFEERDTVFEDAHRAGYSTAVVGWYIPYCRLLPNVLDRCRWSNRDENLTNGLITSGTVLSNVTEPLDKIAAKLGPMPRRVRLAKLQIHDVVELDEAASEVLRERSAGFVLLHLRLPHPPGIYSHDGGERRAGEFTPGHGSYIDNLVLTDRVLAELRTVLEEAGQWDSSTVVVMGDHGWRVGSIWRTLPTWTAEDELASANRDDTAPAYLVKLPGQTAAARLDAVLPQERTRSLLDAILAGQLHTADDLARWTQRQP